MHEVEVATSNRLINDPKKEKLTFTFFEYFLQTGLIYRRTYNGQNMLNCQSDQKTKQNILKKIKCGRVKDKS